jgi:general stress protein 26
LADKFEVVQTFLGSLRAGDNGAAAGAELLDEGAVFQFGMSKITGREAVLQRLAGPEADKNLQQAAWSAPKANREAVQVDGALAAGGPLAGVILLFHVTDGKIALIQQQSVPAAPPPPTELKISPELREVIDNALMTRHPILVTAVTGEGQPTLSYRGSVHVHGDTQLAFWSRHADGTFIRSIAKNPRVTLLYRDPDKRTMLQFHGRAHVPADAATQDRVYDESAEPERVADFARLGTAVVVDLHRIEGSFPGAPGGRVVMAR